MTDFKYNKDLLYKLKLTNEEILSGRNYFDRSDTVSISSGRNYFDRSDTVSIASIQSSIFDLDSSLTSRNLENIKKQDKSRIQERRLPHNIRPFKFNEKVPENWLYSHPKQKNLRNPCHEDPIEWMRTIFDENEEIPQACKSNLKQTLSKSHANLSLSSNLDFDDTPPIVSYKSVSDLKNIEFSDNFKKQSDIEKIPHIMTESKTAPGSIENITEFRSSFQDFVALAKQQEEKLKAEVLKRKIEFSSRNSVSYKQTPSVRFIKNSRKSAPANRFGFSDNSQSKIVTTRYSKPNSYQTKSESISKFQPKLSLQTSDMSKSPLDKFRVYNSDKIRQSVDSRHNLKLYHV